MSDKKYEYKADKSLYFIKTSAYSNIRMIYEFEQKNIIRNYLPLQIMNTNWISDQRILWEYDFPCIYKYKMCFLSNKYEVIADIVTLPF